MVAKRIYLESTKHIIPNSRIEGFLDIHFDEDEDGEVLIFFRVIYSGGYIFPSSSKSEHYFSQRQIDGYAERRLLKQMCEDAGNIF